jgi:hypothetical protein
MRETLNLGVALQQCESYTLLEGFVKYAVEMGSIAMIYISSFSEIGSDTQKCIAGVTETHIQQEDRISLL